MPSDESMPPPVAIVGAGIAGLTLARILSLKKVPVIVYESKAKGKFANHGLWLGEKACQSLATELRIPIEDIRRVTAVTSEIEDTRKNVPVSSGMRVNKRRLLEYLSSGVDVRYKRQVTAINPRIEDQSVMFVSRGEDGDSEVEEACNAVVGADGVHSAVRSAVLPGVKSKVLPYVAINGQMRTSFSQYREEHASEDYQDTVSHKKGPHQTHLSTGLNDVKGGKAYSFFTYSRPARKDSDALFKPDRSTSEASAIPDEFFEEARAVFGERFSEGSMKDVKLLSWLMRSIEVSEQDIEALPGRVSLIGDAGHATPILGGDGGEQAIQDAVELAHQLEAAYRDNKLKVEDAIREFQRGALTRWQRSVRDSVSRLEEMHSASEKL